MKNIAEIGKGHGFEKNMNLDSDPTVLEASVK